MSLSGRLVISFEAKRKEAGKRGRQRTERYVIKLTFVFLFGSLLSRVRQQTSSILASPCVLPRVFPRFLTLQEWQERAGNAGGIGIEDGGVDEDQGQNNHDDAGGPGDHVEGQVLVYSPIRSRRLISRRMKISTTGSQTPFATCEKTRIFRAAPSGKE